MRNYVLFNPFSGHGDTRAKSSEVAEKLKGDCVFLDITKTDYENLFSKVNESDSVVICGGDGTINRFVNDTKDIDIKCNILYYPLGTGNDFFHDLGFKATDCPVSINKYIKDLPIVEVEGKEYKFINNVGFGIDGYCCVVGDEMKKKSTKPVNYTVIAINGLLFNYKPTNAVVKVDGKEYRYNKVWIAPTMKGRFYGGGMMPTPSQDRSSTDGTLSVMIFYGKGRLKTLMAFPSIFKGEHIKHTNMVAIHTGKEIEVSFDDGRPVQIDGEVVPDVTRYIAKTKLKSKI
ncbi:MAG: diacylglycerol kinase family protein [Ruminococcaceae bacterium]|nr:diacylglycerol kinase family protein [Oscillospiraceae bacterium]